MAAIHGECIFDHMKTFPKKNGIKVSFDSLFMVSPLFSNDEDVEGPLFMFKRPLSSKEARWGCIFDGEDKNQRGTFFDMKATNLELLSGKLHPNHFVIDDKVIDIYLFLRNLRGSLKKSPMGPPKIGRGWFAGRSNSLRNIGVSSWRNEGVGFCPETCGRQISIF